MSTYERKPGRPKQPFCPDCKREGNYVRKHKHYGYCKEHKTIRSRRAYANMMKERAAGNYTHPEDLVAQLERDLHDHIKKVGRSNVTVQFIQNAFDANGLPIPDEEAIQKEFLSKPKNDPDIMSDEMYAIFNREVPPA